MNLWKDFSLINKFSTMFKVCWKARGFLCSKFCKVLILLEFSYFKHLWKSRQNAIINDKNTSLCGKTHLKLCFPQGFVEKRKNDRICNFSSLRHKTVAMRKKCLVCPHFVLKFHTIFPQQKSAKKSNQIKGVCEFSTFSTVPIIYYNYYLFYLLFHSFLYIAREKKDKFFTLTKSCRPAKKKCGIIRNRKEMLLWYIWTLAQARA